MRNVAIGPKKRDAIHQFKPLLPFVCARPAFMRERVDQPTAYSPVSRIIIRLLEASGRQPETLAMRNDAYSKMPVLITPGIGQKGNFAKDTFVARAETPRRSHLAAPATHLFAREGPMRSSEAVLRDSGRGGACAVRAKEINTVVATEPARRLMRSTHRN